MFLNRIKFQNSFPIWYRHHQRCSMKKGVLKHFSNSQENTCARGTFATLLKKRLWLRCFPVNFAKFLRTPFLQNTSRRLLLTRTKKSQILSFYGNKRARLNLYSGIFQPYKIFFVKEFYSSKFEDLQNQIRSHSPSTYAKLSEKPTLLIPLIRTRVCVSRGKKCQYFRQF